MKARVLAVAFTVCLMTAGLTMIQRASAFPEVSSPYLTDNTYATLDSMITFENMSVQGRPMYFNTTTYDVYLAREVGGGWATLSVLYDSNDTVKDLHTFGDDVRSIVVAGDGSIVVGLHNKSIYRSTDGGTNFDCVLNMGAGTDPWRMAVRGPIVYAGEYGSRTDGVLNHTLWGSSDYGAVGTWSAFAYTLNETVDRNHWHSIYVDPFTDYVWATHGDDVDGCYLSKDGTTFQRYGPYWQCTAITATEYNVYFGSDPGNFVYCFNKTTEDWSLIADLRISPYSAMATFEMRTGSEGVLYSRTCTEGYSPKLAGIFMSSDGKHWSMIINQTVYTESDSSLTGPANGYFYFGDNLEDGYIHRFRDVTLTEARAICNAPSPRETDSTFSYTAPELAYNNETGYFSLASEHVSDAYLNITGVNVTNYATNGDCETPESFNDTTVNQYFTKKNASETEKWNISCYFDSSRSHNGSYSILVEGLNNTGVHGYLRYIKEGLNWPVSTTATFSLYYQINNTDPNKSRGSGAIGGAVQFYYSGGTTDSFDMLGGVGGNYVAQQANMTSDQWSRTWRTATSSATKVTSLVIIDIYIYGICRVWIDDIQVELGANMTPYVSPGTHQTEDPVLTLGDTEYSYSGTLDDGETTSFALGDMSGLYAYSVECSDSLVFEWSVWGHHDVAAYNAFIEYDTYGVEPTHDYGSVVLGVPHGNTGTFNVPAFFNIETTGETLSVRPYGGQCNVSLIQPYSGGNTSATFDLAGAFSSAIVTITGLAADHSYKVYWNGSVIAVEDGPVITFTATGAGHFEVVEWYSPGVSSLVLMTVDFTMIGIVAAIAVSFMMPMAQRIKDKKTVAIQKMFPEVVRSVVYIVVAVILWVILHNIALSI